MDYRLTLYLESVELLCSHMARSSTMPLKGELGGSSGELRGPSNGYLGSISSLAGSGLKTLAGLYRLYYFLNWMTKVRFQESLDKGILGFFVFYAHYSTLLICRPSDSTVSEDAGIEPRTVATSALTARRSNHSARSHSNSARSHPPTRLDLIHTRLDLIHTRQDLIH